MSRIGMHWEGRLGGKINPIYERRERNAHHISEVPEKIGDRVLKKQVCGDGTKCKACECLDKCNYGKEYLRRGLGK